VYIHIPYIFQNVVFPTCFRSSNWPFRHGFPSLPCSSSGGQIV